MDLPDLTALGALGVPAFVAIFLLGWKSRQLAVEKPRMDDLLKRVDSLEEEVEANRKDKDAQLAALRQKVLG